MTRDHRDDSERSLYMDVAREIFGETSAGVTDARLYQPRYSCVAIESFLKQYQSTKPAPQNFPGNVADECCKSIQKDKAVQIKRVEAGPAQPTNQQMTEHQVELALDLGNSDDDSLESNISPVDQCQCVGDQTTSDGKKHLYCHGECRGRRHSSLVKLVESSWLEPDYEVTSTASSLASSDCADLEIDLQESLLLERESCKFPPINVADSLGTVATQRLPQVPPKLPRPAKGGSNACKYSYNQCQRLQTVHVPSGQKKVTHRIQTKSTSEGTLTMQKRGRQRQIHQCKFCNKVMQTKYKLERHVRTHTGERPFGCEVCHSRFNQKSSLKTHSTMHAKALLREPNSTSEAISKYRINGYTFEELGIPFAEHIHAAMRNKGV